MLEAPCKRTRREGIGGGVGKAVANGWSTLAVEAGPAGPAFVCGGVAIEKVLAAWRGEK